MSQSLKDYSNPVSLILDESSSEVDGEHVLAKVRGPFFFPGGVSRNQRYYPPELWENTLQNEEVLNKLKDRTMLGTVYHPQQEPPLEDNSHIVTKLWVDPNNKKVGMGEALIINTEKGRALNTLLRLGSKWCVSSRASGKFLPSKNESGVPVVDPDSYILQTFDFTPDPGFVDANPQLVESLLPGNSIKQIVEVGSVMDNNNTSKAMFESLLNEKKNLESTISDLLSENEAYSKLGSPEDVTKALELAKTQGEILKEYLDRGSIEDFDVLNEEFNQLRETLARYKGLGTTRQIKEVFKRVAETLVRYNEFRSEYNALGSPEEIKEVYIRASKMGDLLKKYTSLGTPKEIREAFDEALRGLDIISAYKNLGSVKEIKEAFKATNQVLDAFKEYKSIGSVDEIQESYKKVLEALEELKTYKNLASVKEVTEYTNLGTPDAIQETFDKTEEFVKYHRSLELEREAPNYASEYGLSENIVKTIIETIGDDEEKIRTTLAKMRDASRSKTNFFDEEKVDVATANRPLERTIIKSIAESL